MDGQISIRKSTLRLTSGTNKRSNNRVIYQNITRMLIHNLDDISDIIYRIIMCGNEDNIIIYHRHISPL